MFFPCFRYNVTHPMQIFSYISVPPYKSFVLRFIFYHSLLIPHCQLNIMKVAVSYWSQELLPAFNFHIFVLYDSVLLQIHMFWESLVRLWHDEFYLLFIITWWGLGGNRKNALRYVVSLLTLLLNQPPFFLFPSRQSAFTHCFSI